MFIDLIATFAAGFAGAGVVLILNHLTRGRLPKWAMPMAAGSAMLGMSIWSEYTWAARTIAGQPEGVVELHTVEESKPWKPWTYVVPQATRFMALDTATIRDNPEHPDVRLVDLYLFARWAPPAKVTQFVNCADATRADATNAVLADFGRAQWLPLDQDDPLLQGACQT